MTLLLLFVAATYGETHVRLLVKLCESAWKLSGSTTFLSGLPATVSRCDDRVDFGAVSNWLARSSTNEDLPDIRGIDVCNSVCKFRAGGAAGHRCVTGAVVLALGTAGMEFWP
jgi:hypothetical protein